MRDEHRFREKIELSLENRHVRAIAFGAMLFLGAAFSVGVLVGKRLASRAAVPAALDDLEALDARTLPGHGRPSAPPAGRGEATRPGTGTAGTASSGTPPAHPGRPEVTRPGTGNGAPRGDSPVTSDTAGVRDSVASPVPLPPADPPPSPPAPAARPAPVRTIPAPPSTTSVAPGPRTAQVTAPQTGALPPPPLDVGKFTVQVGATQDRVEARQMVVLASKGGLRPYVAEARLAGRGLWYRVRLGAFADRAAADQYRRDVERELHMPALVMPTR
jgi:cell division septation protein DedD